MTTIVMKTCELPSCEERFAFVQKGRGRPKQYCKKHRGRCNLNQRALKKGSLRRLLNHRFAALKHRAKQRGIELGDNVDTDYLHDIYDEQEGRCALTGVVLELVPGSIGSRNPAVLSVDRKDSSIGYVRGNIHLTTWAANHIKGKRSIDEAKKHFVGTIAALGGSS